MSGQFREMRFLPVVKAYPALSATYGEVSCVAGVEMGPAGPEGWVRLYPVSFRALGDGARFAKYQPITLRVRPPSNDRRPETWRPDQDSIRVAGDALSTRDGWRARRPWIEPLMAESMCELLRRQRLDGTSLGIFRPRAVEDLVIAPVEVARAKQQAMAAWAGQTSLMGFGTQERNEQLRAIELMPWRFIYNYRCADRACGGHRQSITDWEIFQFYRRVRDAADWQQQVRDRFVGTLCGSERETAFVVGNQHQHPGSFLVLSVWWPERRASPGQMSLTEIADDHVA
ncbi:hypothetical protein [Patulibacter defluvii]|uniref:hypothetical protein n=1 Tax=Patulibacter defluvii TaxID=3095358 RepID=UPI002A7516F9|nr:hypothetical protein [Patulibacter sp. DM4]